ncbi:MAG: Rrf2 family transcriptional regulator [Blautia sp.]|nr:Rrf2 family transcriptional regulator [Blautia sp.]
MISTKGRYALRVMIDLAQYPTEEYVPLKDIAARQEISEKYLEIILKVLVKKKLLKGLRGKGGGYRLTRSPKDYTVGEILELTEGTISQVACLMPDAEKCPREDSCITLPLWKKLNGLIHNFFYNITLEDLINGNF